MIYEMVRYELFLLSFHGFMIATIETSWILGAE